MFGLYLLVALVTQFAPEEQLPVAVVEVPKSTVSIGLSNVSGIKAGTCVTYKGDVIGEVANVRENRTFNRSLNSKDLSNNYLVEVSLSSDSNIKSGSNIIALVAHRINSDELEGEKVIELFDNKLSRAVKDTRYIKGYVSYREFWMSKDI